MRKLAETLEGNPTLSAKQRGQALGPKRKNRLPPRCVSAKRDDHMRSSATTVKEYLRQLPADREKALRAVDLTP